jgi:3-oxoacyl-[acyl-carrier-protein] synthase II
VKRRVVITGTGAITSLGNSAQALTDRWIAGESGIVDGRSACTEFEPTDVMGKKEVRRSDRFTQLAIAAVAEALEEAGWNGGSPYSTERVGCVIGTGIGGIATLEKQARNCMERGPGAISPLTVPMIMPNSAAGYVAMRHGWQGPAFAVGSACATGGHAIGVALRTIQAGDADAMLAGGTEASLTEIGLGSFAAMEALSPTGISRPFDARRDGFVMGEGAGALMLEAAELAEARGARILGEVLGYGSTTDAYHITAPDPAARQAVRAIEMALADAGRGTDDVAYVNAHGTGTELNDRTETVAIKAALGDDAARMPVSSIKSVIGHLLGAAGIVEAVATLHAMKRGMAPPTVGYSDVEEGMDLDYVPDANRALLRAPGANGAPATALSNSFGFGGHNVVLCICAV